MTKSVQQGGDLFLGSAALQKTFACARAAQNGKLVIIADFDRTITRCFLPDGGRGSSAHGVLDGSNLLSEDWRAKTKVLFDKYFPIEIDPKMSVEEKIPLMTEWYTQVHSLMLKQGITRDQLKAVVAECRSIQLREGFADFLQSCQDAQPPVPVLIMSAGLGDVIEEFLNSALPFALASTTMVVSNRFHFDDGGNMVGFSEPLLHMFNKSAAWLPDKAQHLVRGCSHCLLLGDGVGDITMADGLQTEVLRVGFLNEKIDEKLVHFREIFDVVKTNDGPVPAICFQAIGRSVRSAQWPSPQRLMTVSAIGVSCLAMAWFAYRRSASRNSTRSRD